MAPKVPFRTSGERLLDRYRTGGVCQCFGKPILALKAPDAFSTPERFQIPSILA
jgi:hypothetical protein